MKKLFLFCVFLPLITGCVTSTYNPDRITFNDGNSATLIVHKELTVEKINGNKKFLSKFGKKLLVPVNRDLSFIVDYFETPPKYDSEFSQYFEPVDDIQYSVSYLRYSLGLRESCKFEAGKSYFLTYRRKGYNGPIRLVIEEINK